MKKQIKNIILIIITLSLLISCNKEVEEIDDNILYVYNWGLYIDETTITDFENETGIKVIYDTFDTNEEMFAVVNSKSRVYDVLCPTDYMIEKMIKKNLLYSFDITKLNNYKSLDKNILNIMSTFDKNNEYAVPYVHSTIGIIYNKTILNKKNLPYPTKWADLFDEKYKSEILMQDAMRDLLMVGLKKNNFSMNTLNKNELEIAKNDLIAQKPLVNAYVIDQVRDKMILGEGSVGVTYSGEVEYIRSETKDTEFEYEYILPKEGVNLTLDCWVIPKNATHKMNAIKWIDFMTRPDIAYKNFIYMTYGIPNVDTIKMLDKNYTDNKAIFPDLSDISKYEIYKDLGDKGEELYNDAFKKIKSE